MKFEEMLSIVGDEPVFDSALLLAGRVRVADLRRQLSRWVQSGRVLMLRRGIYALAAPYRKVSPHPFLVANRLVRGSYVSCQSALAHHGLLPEATPVVVSVCSSRPASWRTPLGTFVFRHLHRRLMHGYELAQVGGGQAAFLAAAEKALLDLVHLTAGGDDAGFLQELRLHDLDRLDLETLQSLAGRSRSPKLSRAARRIGSLARAESAEYRQAS